MANLIVTIRAETLAARLLGVQDRLKQELRSTVSRLAIKMQRIVKGDKLTGQVLHVRTGTLRRSINQRVYETATGVFGQVGTNVKYAAVHEYGFDGVVSVRSYARRSSAQMHLARFRTRKSDGARVEVKGSYAKAGGGDGEVQVRAHNRHMHIPKRSFLLSTLHEMKDEIDSSLRKAVGRALNGR